MDLMRVESNWSPSSPLKELVSINQEQSWSDSTTCDNPITLTLPSAPCETRPCHVTIDSSQCDQCITHIRVISGARTIEYYTEEDPVYGGSSRGAFIRIPDDQREKFGRLYCCIMDVSEDHTSFITLKLPSLKGTEKVILTKIEVKVANSANTFPPNIGTSRNLEHEVDSIYSMLQNTSNAPPFVTSLLTALKTSNVSSTNMNDLTAMFKQIHNVDTPTETQTPPIEENVHVAEEVQQDDLSIEGGDIKRYIDKKFLELKEHIDEQLQQMKTDILYEINKNWKKD